MNLSKLFEMQRKLDERIVREKGLEGHNLLDKKILALQVELGELANEWRGFKFWSNDQKPRTVKYIENRKHRQNPLLEEYVDCLHFILSIGLEIGVVIDKVKPYRFQNIIDQFRDCICRADMMRYASEIDYRHLLMVFLGLGEMLGFTWEQIEESYFEKNRINHERQNNGY